MWNNIYKYLPHNLVTITTGIVVFVFLFYQWVKRPKNFPPGPIGLPVLGVAHKLTNRAEVALTDMGKEYGPIVGVKLLRNFTVVLNSYEAIQQAFVKQGHIFAGRPQSEIFRIFTNGRGIVAIDGPKWKENRKFGMFVFRKLGIGKKILEEKIVDEMIYMNEVLQLRTRKPFDISNLVCHTVSNVICNLSFGERFEYDDLEFISVAKTLVEWFSENADAFMLMMLAPFLVKFPPFKQTAESLRQATNKLYTLLLPFIKSHKETLDGYEMRDFVEAYLNEIEKTKDDPNSVYTEEELKGYIRDLFVAGTDTTTGTIKWALIFLINRPEVQKKIQKEIDSTIGPDARPKMTHLDDMHYTKAVMTEIFRFRTPGPLGLAHRALEDTVLMGYNIPKNTQVMSNFWAIHRDPKLWERPDEFMPERFLDENKKFKKSPYVLPFSIGSRYCMGESIAKMEYFFFLVVTLQRFHLEPASPDEFPLREECEKSGQFLVPPNFKMKVVERFCRARSIKEYQDSMWDN